MYKEVKNQLKLRDILPYIFFLTDIRIYDVDFSDEEPVFTGTADDVPWTLADARLYNDDNGESIGIDKIDGKPYISIWVNSNDNQ